jgi:outer membrane lipoprotein-sorting protein
VPARVNRFLVLILAVLLAGCPHHVDYGSRGRITDPAEVLAAVAARYAAVHGLTGEGKLAADTPDVKGTLKMALEVQEPSSIYLETADPLGTPRGTFVTDGDRFVFYRPDENTFVDAPATADHIGRYLPLPLTPADLASALLGEPPLIDATLARLEVDETADTYVITLREGAVQQRVKVGTRDLRLLSVETRGAPRYDAFFEDHRMLDGVLFPTTVVLRVNRAHVEVKLRYTDIRLNPTSDPATFHLAPPPSARVERY